MGLKNYPVLLQIKFYPSFSQKVYAHLCALNSVCVRIRHAMLNYQISIRLFDYE